MKLEKLLRLKISEIYVVVNEETACHQYILGGKSSMWHMGLRTHGNEHSFRFLVNAWGTTSVIPPLFPQTSVSYLAWSLSHPTDGFSCQMAMPQRSDLNPGDLRLTSTTIALWTKACHITSGVGIKKTMPEGKIYLP